MSQNTRVTVFMAFPKPGSSRGLPTTERRDSGSLAGEGTKTETAAPASRYVPKPASLGNSELKAAIPAKPAARGSARLLLQA